MAVGWHPSLATGIAVIDEQHQEIFRRLADLIEALERSSRAEIPKMFDFLGDYVLEHFGAEERAMAQVRYPGLNVHRAAHERFAREYIALKTLYDAAGPSVAIAVKTATWVSDWLQSHIWGADHALAKYLRQYELEAG